MKIVLPFPELLQELEDYASDKSFQSKVLRIYAKCLQFGKLELAKKIRDKYGRYFPKDDLATAFGWALLASKRLI